MSPRVSNQERPASPADRTLRALHLIRRILLSRVSTLAWRIFHLPFVKLEPRVRVAMSVSVRPMWSYGSRLHVLLRRGSSIYGNVVLQGSGCIELGERSFISHYCVIGSQSLVRIGADVMIAAAVTIRDSDHVFADIDRAMNTQGVDVAPVIIEDDVWIGHGAVILKGVRIGTGAVVAAGAVVRSDVEPRTVVGGVPARVISRR